MTFTAQLITMFKDLETIHRKTLGFNPLKAIACITFLSIFIKLRDSIPPDELGLLRLVMIRNMRVFGKGGERENPETYRLLVKFAGEFGFPIPDDIAERNRTGRTHGGNAKA